MSQPIIVNTYYPLGYFASVDLAQAAPSGERFWSSNEATPPSSEYLIFDFNTVRALNFIDFEIIAKPIDIDIYYDIDGSSNFVPVSYQDGFNVPAVTYVPSSDTQPWIYVEFHLELIQTRRLKVVFTRRTDLYPLEDSSLFAWSIDVRNTRVAHLIMQQADAEDEIGVFIPDTGVDILGNSYRTELVTYPVTSVTDYDTQTFWQSQPNPSRYAVEALYFDLRPAFGIGAMEDLNLIPINKLNNFTMTDLDGTTIESGVVVDEIYIDPVTYGCDMHIYYSDDDEPDWENKLWSPIPRHYVVKKGFHPLPAPTKAKFFKLEFSNLVAQPYNALEYPTLPPITYRRYPMWVQSLFETLFPPQFTEPFENPNEQVSVEPLDFFKNLTDRLDTTLSDVVYTPAVLTENEDIIENFILDTTGQSVIADAQSTVEQQINFNPPTLWQSSLEQLLDVSRALSRYVLEANNTIYSDWEVEQAVDPLATPTFQSVEDLSDANIEKQTPIMWFPRRCRHSYQLIQAQRPSKIAYYVAIKEVTFHRRDTSVPLDHDFYIETLDDTAQVELNEFTQADWRYVV